VRLSSQVDLLGLNLVRYVHQQHIEKVVAREVWLEHNLDFVGLLRRDCSLLGDQQEWDLLLFVLSASDQRLQLESHCERGNIFNFERFFINFSNKNVSEIKETLLRFDRYFRPDTAAFHKDGDSCVL